MKRQRSNWVSDARCVCEISNINEVKYSLQGIFVSIYLCTWPLISDLEFLIILFRNMSVLSILTNTSGIVHVEYVLVHLDISKFTL